MGSRDFKEAPRYPMSKEPETTTNVTMSSAKEKSRATSFRIPMELEVKRFITRANGDVEPEEVVGRSAGWIDFDGHNVSMATGGPELSPFVLWIRQRWEYFKLGLWGLKNLATTGKIRGS